MKRVIVISILIGVMVTLFAFPVSANGVPETYNRYDDSVVVNGVTYDLRAIQFKTSSMGTSMLPGGMESIMYITIVISNNNNQAALCTQPKFDLEL